MMRDIPLTVVAVITMLLGFYWLADTLSGSYIEWRYPAWKGDHPTLFDPERPVGERFYYPYPLCD